MRIIPLTFKTTCNGCVINRVDMFYYLARSIKFTGPKEPRSIEKQLGQENVGQGVGLHESRSFHQLCNENKKITLGCRMKLSSFPSAQKLSRPASQQMLITLCLLHRRRNGMKLKGGRHFDFQNPTKEWSPNSNNYFIYFNILLIWPIKPWHSLARVTTVPSKRCWFWWSWWWSDDQQEIDMKRISYFWWMNWKVLGNIYYRTRSQSNVMGVRHKM